MGVRSTSSGWTWGLVIAGAVLLPGLLLSALPRHIIPSARTQEGHSRPAPEAKRLLPPAPPPGVSPHVHDAYEQQQHVYDAHENQQHVYEDHRPGLRLALDHDTPRSLLEAYRSGANFDAVSRLEEFVWVSEWRNLAAIDSLHELYLEQGLLDSAIGLLRNALEIHTEHTGFMIKLAETLQLHHEHDEALTIIAQVLHTDPLNIHALERYRILLQERTGETAYFLIWSEDLLRQYPNNSDLYLNLASAYRDDVHDDMAAEVYKEGIKNNPQDSELKRAFADFLVGAYQFTEAIDLYQQYIQANPDNPYGYVQLGHIYLQLDDHEQAYTFYQKAIALAPEYVGEITQSLAGRGLTPDGLFAR